MSKKIYFIVCLFLVVCCSPSKRIKQSIQDAEQIASSLNNLKHTPIKDSVVHLRGHAVSISDTTLEIDSTTFGRIIERHFYKTLVKQTDSIKTITRDEVTERSLRNENEKLKGELTGAEKFSNLVERQNKRFQIIIICFAVAFGILFVLLLKRIL